MTTPVTPTQVKRPGRATFRTLFAQAVGWLIGAGLILPLVLAIVQEELGDVIPPGVMGWVVLFVGVVVGISTVVTRVMAIPQVDAWFAKYRVTSGLAADPDSKPPVDPQPFDYRMED